LKLAAEFIQVPIGLEGEFQGVIDIVNKESCYFLGEKGDKIQRVPMETDPNVTEDMKSRVEELRQHLIEKLADIDEEMSELFLNDVQPTIENIKDAIRRQTIACQFVPVCMGSAFKNKGVQLLLDAVNDFLPAPTEKVNTAFDLARNEEKVELKCSPNENLVALAFKLEESRFGQLTYLRVYQGVMKKGMFVINQTSGKKHKIPRIVRMHANEMEEIDQAGAGDVVAVFGIECASMDTFTDGNVQYSLASMYVPKPVMSLSVKPKDMQQLANFSKAIAKFTREDPTLRVSTDAKTGETIMSGMGELHLEIYIERMKREYNVECVTGNPSVNYKETISVKTPFNYLHKKQSGGAGQYGRVIGYIEPVDLEEAMKKNIDFEFENQVVGTNIPPEFIPSCEKGAKSACEKGVLAGHSLFGVRVVLTDGQAHAVDSNDMAFQLAMQYAIRQAVKAARPSILEPIMSLEVNAPADFQGTIMGGLNKRGGLIMATDLSDDGGSVRILADVPLSAMFGYSTDLRSSTQGKGEFSMEYKEHRPVNKELQEELIKAHAAKTAGEE
jgi:elongation factor G